jgi:hypothetical protein
VAEHRAILDGDWLWLHPHMQPVCESQLSFTYGRKNTKEKGRTQKTEDPG